MFLTQGTVSNLKNKTIIKHQITNTNFTNISQIIRKIAISRGDKDRNNYKN